MCANRMTPRERVLCALSHRQPDRVPFSWGFGPTAEMSEHMDQYLADKGVNWQHLCATVDDTRWVASAKYLGEPILVGNDIWGVQRKPVQAGKSEYWEISHYPLAGVESTEELKRYPWPHTDCYDYSLVRSETLNADPTRTYAHKCFYGNPFETYCWMTGLEESMVNLIANPQIVVTALDYITSYYEVMLRQGLEHTGDLVDMVFLADDLGSQQGLLMSRKMYREILQPFHWRLADAVHQMAPHAKILFHSDGAVFDILPDLIDAGIDILEAVQVDAAGMDPTRLKATYGEHLAFHGAISVQALLPNKTQTEVADECRRLVSVLGQGGGYIAAPSHAIQVGTPPENVLAMLQSVLGDEDYQIALQGAQMK